MASKLSSANPKDNRKRHIVSRHVVVIGAGGLIGSHLISHLARLPVTAVTLIDHDIYTEINLLSQDILPGDVGKPKALVQARRLKKINPQISVRSIVDSVENVPLAELKKGDVLLATLDSKHARMIVNERAFILGIPWIDSGVNGQGLLARVNAYKPGTSLPCLECAFSEKDYANIDRVYSCAISPGINNRTEPPATNSPSYLGALAASLLAGECGKFLDDNTQDSLIGKQELFDIKHHNYYLTSLPFNRNCQMPFHDKPITKIENSESRDSLEELYNLANELNDGLAKEYRKNSNTAPDITENDYNQGYETIQVVGQDFITKLICEKEGHEIPVLRLRASFNGNNAGHACKKCDGSLVISGLDIKEHLRISDLSRDDFKLPFRELGIRTGDIVKFSTAGRNECYFEVKNGVKFRTQVVKIREPNKHKSNSKLLSINDND